MGVEENKATLKRMYEEVWNTGDVSKLPELVSPDYQMGDIKGPEGLGQAVNMFHTGIPDVHFTIDQVIGEGDSIAYRITGEGTHQGDFGNLKPTGKKLKWTQYFFQEYKEGKVLHTVGLTDMLGILQQMGYVPPNEEIGK